MDEVGRGALAGPVCVGVAVIDQLSLENPEFPQGFPARLNDSKQLTERRRLALQDPLRAWVRDFAIGQASNTEIDELGIMPALRLAGWRALNELDAADTCRKSWDWTGTSTIWHRRSNPTCLPGRETW